MMDSSIGNQSFRRKKMTKQLTGKRDDSAIHLAARAGKVEEIKEMIAQATDDVALKELLSKQNHSGETVLYVAAEYGYVDLVHELIKHHDPATAGIKAKNGLDALLISAKQGDVDVVKELLQTLPELSMTVDPSNTTALHTAATQGHTQIVSFVLELDQSLALIARSNGKTALHSAARNGHVAVVRALLEREPGIAPRTDKKGQTALHMAVKGTSVDLVNELLRFDPSLLNLVDSKGNTALHIAARKGRAEILKRLLELPGTDTKAINRLGETAFDTAEKTGNSQIMSILMERGVPSARSMGTQTGTASRARELKQTVSDIKHEVHSQLEHTRQTRRQVQDIVKRLNKLHAEGLNNAINSTTVVAVLIATVAFAAIFTVPGQYVNSDNLAPGETLGEANVSHETAFMIFFVFDSVALFISLAVVVVQTSVVVIESRAKKQMVAIVNKLMWLACVLTSVAFLALAFIVVGKKERWLAIGVTIMGTTILAATLGTMIYWVVAYRMEARKMRRASTLTRSKSWSVSAISDTEWIDKEYKRVYAI